MKNKKPKVYKVRYNGRVEFMTGASVSLLQTSGAKVKIIRKATYDESTNLKS